MARTTYSDVVNNLRKLSANIPELTSRLRGGNAVQEAIDTAGFELIKYEADHGFPQGREFQSRRLVLDGDIERVSDLARTFQSDEAGIEERLICAVKNGEVTADDIVTATAQMETKARCARVISLALVELREERLSLEKSFNALPEETRISISAPDVLTPYERENFEGNYAANKS